jgi:uncharacterized protein (DUF4415 family)
MNKEVDFTSGKPSRGKTRLTIWIDMDIVEWFTAQIASRETQQAMLNDALRWHIESGGSRTPGRKSRKRHKE